MLGYVRIFKPDLKVREYEIYQGYYCGVCKYIGSRYGQIPRFSLSYDAAFLALMLESLSPAEDRPSREHCIAHHIQKKTVVRNKAVQYAGDIMLILAWYKLKDDAKDENSKTAKATMVLFRKIFNKLRAQYPDLCRNIEKNLFLLRKLEQEKCSSLDPAAEPFSQIMALIFHQGSTLLYGNDKNLHQSFANIGYHLGKWIYLIDAADDIEDNIDTGAYNPLLYRFDYKGRMSGNEELASETPNIFRRRIEKNLEFNLYQYLSVLGEEIQSLDIEKNQGIIENIIYFGLNMKTEEILARDGGDKNKKERGKD